MSRLRRAVLAGSAALFGFSLGAIRVSGAPASPAPPIDIAYVGGSYPKPEYLSLVQVAPDDAGEAGVELALHEINVAGRFLGRSYTVDKLRLKPGAASADQLRPLLARTKIIVADLEPDDLMALADMPEAKDALILDMRTSSDELRSDRCKLNTFHLLPSTAMRTDALGQYLVFKRWTRWFVLEGTTPRDKAYAADIARTAKLFGGKIVETRSYGYDVGSRRVDTGYQQIQKQMPLATRNAPEHDVLFVADVGDIFGDYLPYAATTARPVVGTQGLVATAWSPAFQEYSALQMQRRFEAAAHRPMLEADYAGWLAMRAVGEAAIRSGKSSSEDLAAFMRSPKFSVAGFKGQPLTFRPWNQQLRQPVLLATPLMVVSMSPQEGFLHPKNLTDTLGDDEAQTRCHLAS